MLRALRVEMFQDQFDFPSREFFIEGNEKIRKAKVAVEFWDFIFENQMVAERVPGQFANEAMVLMQVRAVVRENYVR
jgi:hypothetical protein